MTQSKNSRIKDIRKADKFTLHIDKVNGEYPYVLSDSGLELRFVKQDGCKLNMDLPVMGNRFYNEVTGDTFVNVRRNEQGLMIKATSGLELGYLPKYMAEKITINVFDAKVHLDGDQPRIKFTLSNMYHTI